MSNQPKKSRSNGNGRTKPKPKKPARRGNQNRGNGLPAAYARAGPRGPPRVRMGGATATISHSEPLQAIIPGSTELRWRYQLNPGLARNNAYVATGPNPDPTVDEVFDVENGPFSWLTAIANQYEFYRFTKVELRYVPKSAAFTSGGFALGVDYDPKDRTALDAEQLLNYTGAHEVAYWQPFTWRLNPAMMHMNGPKFTRSTYVSETDLKTYDAASLQIFMDAGAPIALGRLWIDYTVILTTPQLQSLGLDRILAPPAQTAMYRPVDTGMPLAGDLLKSVPASGGTAPVPLMPEFNTIKGLAAVLVNGALGFTVPAGIFNIIWDGVWEATVAPATLGHVEVCPQIRTEAGILISSMDKQVETNAGSSAIVTSWSQAAMITGPAVLSFILGTNLVLAPSNPLLTSVMLGDERSSVKFERVS